MTAREAVALPAERSSRSARRAGTTSMRDPQATVGIVLVILAGLVAWQAIVGFGVVDDRYVASPTQIVHAAYELAQEPRPRLAVLGAIGMFLAAFAVAAVIGVLAGAAMGLSRIVHRVFHPFVLGLFSTPKMIFIPIFILVVGLGATSKISYAAVSAFFPVAVTVTAGVRTVDKRLLLAAESMGASWFQRLRSVIIPASLPSVMTALWFGMKHALLGVLIMELVASQQGIGFFIARYSAASQTPRVYALILTMALFAILLGSLWRWQERRMSRWRARH